MTASASPVGAVQRTRTSRRLALPADRGWMLPLATSALAFLLAFWQRPLRAYTDTRIELSADPALFVHRIAHLWSASTDLGHVQATQFVGFIFPMGSWFSLTNAVGIPMWVSQRLWLGALLALAAWGVIRLLDEVYDRHRGVAHLGAAVLYMANPFVALYASRGTGNLLAYVALPWLIVFVVRGLRAPRRWAAPIGIALVLTAAGGGQNAALVGWILPGPIGFALYETVLRRRAVRDLLALAWRTVLCAVVASAWWVVPLAVSARFGSDFLRFSEQPDAIFANASAPEALRLLGYWIGYFGWSYSDYGAAAQPIIASTRGYLFSAPLVAGSLLVPFVALGLGLRWLRGWLYAPFFALLGVVGVVFMTLGFPESSPVSHALTSLYYHGGGVQGLRTTYKAGPLVALAIAVMGGPAAAYLMVGARRIRFARVRPWVVAAGAGGALAVLAIAWGGPLYHRHGIDDRKAYGHIPASWRAAIRDTDRALPAGQREMVLPGALFADYRWGSTETSVAPAISRRPVLVREISRWADARAQQLQVTIDDLVGQGRLVPGELAGLLNLLDVGRVIVEADGDPTKTSALDPSRLQQALAGQPELARPLASYGAVRGYVPPPGRSGSGVSVPDLRVFAGAPPGAALVRVRPRTGATVLDGDASGVIELAAHRALGPGALFYAGDTDSTRLETALAAGAGLVFTDSNRRRKVLASQTQANLGPTLGPDEQFARGDATYDPFPHTGTDAQTVASYTGLRYLRTRAQSEFVTFPQNRPYAAMDGRLDTSWIASSSLPSQRYIELAPSRPRPVAAVSVYPEGDIAGRTDRLGITVNGGHERPVAVRPGWNSIRLDARPLRTLRVRVLHVSPGSARSLGGITELRVPGLHVTEALRLPTDLAASARGFVLPSTPMSVLLERTTADFPYRAGANDEVPQVLDRLSMLDAEPGLERIVSLPVARSFSLDGWGSVDPRAHDSAIDRLVGMPGRWTFDSSSRFEGVPGRRASSAFDGDRSTEWVGDASLRTYPWLYWQAPRAISVRKLRIEPGDPAYQVPATVRLSAAGRWWPALRVGADGTVTLPRRVRTRSMKIQITATRTPPQAAARRLGAVAISEVAVPGLHAPAPRRQGTFRTRCGELTVSAAGRTATAQVSGLLSDLDSGAPLRIASCGRAGKLPLPAGGARLSAPPGEVMRPDHLRLASIPPGSAAAVAPGTASGGSGYDDGAPHGVRVAVSRPSWLVLSESYSRGWRAWCRDGQGREHSLGRPQPIDGFANGWPIDSSCQVARFAFAPQKLADASYVVSAIGVAALLAVLLLGLALRGRRGDASALASAPGPVWRSLPPDDVRRLSPLASLAVVGCVAGAAYLLGGAIAAAVAGAAAVAVLIAGISARRLTLLAALGLAAVPAMYLLHPARDLGGFNFAYAHHHLAAHWVALAAVACLAAAALLDGRAVRRSR